MNPLIKKLMEAEAKATSVYKNPSSSADYKQYHVFEELHIGREVAIFNGSNAREDALFYILSKNNIKNLCEALDMAMDGLERMPHSYDCAMSECSSELPCCSCDCKDETLAQINQLLEKGE